MASALRAASTLGARKSAFRMRPISLLTRLSAAANTCWMLSCAGKASASRRSFPARGPAVLARQRAFLIAHIAQTPAQRLKVIKPDIVDFGMVTAQDDFMLIVTENVTLEFARYGHG